MVWTAAWCLVWCWSWIRGAREVASDLQPLSVAGEDSSSLPLSGEFCLFTSLFSLIGCHSHQDLLKPHLHLNNMVAIPQLWSRCSCCFVTFWGSQATEGKVAECPVPNVLKWIQTHLSSGSIKAAHSHCLFQLTSVTWSLFFCYSHYPVNQAVHLNLP